MTELRTLLSRNWWGRALFLIGLLALFSCEETTGPGEETGAVQRKLLIYTGNDTISANGGQTPVLVKVYADDDTTNVVSGVKVSFSASQAGTKLFLSVQNEITDGNGYARATLYGGSRAGTAAVTASIPNYSNTAFLTVTFGGGLVNSNKAAIPADGLSEATITATVIDSLGQPLPGAQVQFLTTAGTISPQAYSDQDGKAVATLRSEASITDITASVTAQSSAGKIAKIVESNNSRPAVTNGDIPATGDEDGEAVAVSAAKTAATEGVLGSTSVIFRGITVSGSAVKSLVFANGADSTIVTVNVRETTTNLPLSNANLTFSTNLGAVRQSTGTTDSNGDVSFRFFGGNVSGTALVTATYTAGLFHTEQITLTKEVYMSLESSPSTISANGADVSTIKAILYDADNNPIVGETVYFSSTLGRIISQAETNEWGEASVALRSSRFNGTAEVTARYSAIEKTTPVQFTGGGISVTATPLILVADGESASKVTVTLTDASGAPLVDERVSFSTTLGTLTSINGSGSGSALLDSTTTAGKVSVNLKSSQPGNAVVRITTAGVSDSISVNFTNYSFSLQSGSSSIPAGGGTVAITATLRNNDGAIIPITPGQIVFSATLGAIGSISSQADGTVRAILTSGSTAGNSTVTASMTNPAVTASASVGFNASEVGSVILEASRNFVRVGGNAVALTAKVFDLSGNPKQGETVTFTIVKGPGGGEHLDTGTAVTNESGQASVSFISGSSGSLQNGVEVSAHVGSTTDVVMLTISGQPHTVVVGYDPESYINNEDGTSSVLVSAIVSDVNRNKVVDGTVVNFSLTGSVGVIAPEVGTIDGVASTRLTYSASDAGKSVLLTAAAGGKEGIINFPLPGFKVSYMSISAAPKSIPGDGISKTVITATLFDVNGSSDNVPDSTLVSFMTSAGTLNPVVARTIDGVATTTLTSDRSQLVSVTVTAQSGTYSVYTNVNFTEVTSNVVQVNEIQLTTEVSELLADGIASTQITARLLQFGGAPVTIPTTVTFESNIGQITEFARSDSFGIARANFTSGEVGTATIKAMVGDVVGYITVIAEPGDPQSVELFFDPAFVNVQGSGKNESLLITADVKDAKNNPVADRTYVQFELVGFFDPASSLSPKGSVSYRSMPVPTLNGKSIVSFNAGTRAGAVRIKATVVDENGALITPIVSSETTQFLVYSGPPYLDLSDTNDPFTESRMTIYCGPLNIFADQIGTDYNKSTVTVMVADRYNNPVPAGTAVYFTTTGGTITTSTAYTNDEGMATVTIYGSNPFPTRTNSSTVPNPNAVLGGPSVFTVPGIDFDGDGMANDGIGAITAYTEGVDHLGRNVTVWNYARIVFSRQVATFTVIPDATILGVGQSTTLAITLRDVNGNPVVGGSELAITTTAGALSKREIITADPGQTTYYVTLTNDLDPFTDQATNAVVSVVLESPNGNYSADSIPVYLILTQ